MHIRVFLFVSSIAALVLAANSAAAAEKKEPEKKGKIVRARDLIEFRNHFKNLGLAYATFEAERGKGPANLDELKPYLQGANKMIDMLAKEEIIFYYGVSKTQMMENGTSNTILAHEAYEDVNGRRLVLMGDGSVHEMTNEQFQKAPKAKK